MRVSQYSCPIRRVVGTKGEGSKGPIAQPSRLPATRKLCHRQCFRVCFRVTDRRGFERSGTWDLPEMLRRPEGKNVGVQTGSVIPAGHPAYGCGLREHGRRYHSDRCHGSDTRCARNQQSLGSGGLHRESYQRFDPSRGFCRTSKSSSIGAGSCSQFRSTRARYGPTSSNELVGGAEPTYAWDPRTDKPTRSSSPRCGGLRSASLSTNGPSLK